MMTRISLLFSALAAVVLSASAGTRLLPGSSIDFNTPALWGKDVTFFLDDQGAYTGDKHWYSSLSDPGAVIQKHTGSETVSGYMKTTSAADVHRSIPVLSNTESSGPIVPKGEPIPVSGLYVDTRIALSVHDSLTLPRVADERDKVNLWLYQAPGGSAAKLVVTAGSYETLVDEVTGVTNYVMTATNYVTDAQVSADEEFRLTVRALPDVYAEYPGLVGFEVFVNGVQATCGEMTAFPSMVKPNPSSPSEGRSARLYSLGFSGAVTAEMINFTKVDPIANPTYDQEDLSMLRETALVTVSGYPSVSQALYDFPMLVRVSETAIPGFSYSRAAYGGTDIRFTDANGKLLPCEVETWDPEGESLIWVKVPLFSNGVTVRMHWSLRVGGSLPGNNYKQVWSDYLAVWHMSESATGKVKDSTGNGHTASVTNGLIAVDGVLGKAGSLTGGTLRSNAFDALGDVTFTGWYRQEADLTGQAPLLFGTRNERTTVGARSAWRTRICATVRPATSVSMSRCRICVRAGCTRR